ncbi:hypothetical protein KMB83_gp08 [Ralstonia phage Anchaing]|uniref:Uncharacterized protein n=1 Tax=Ralstonia phage Anchaing TaxID=2759719 RepID=A0A7G5B8A5_9CAUD|nr:hypothetical protein KMB83_gp08 [Ralstonia phage Anchaing]QMV32528.1 hypothetical protein A1_00008 [Ralstonia phage Anchaing]
MAALARPRTDTADAGLYVSQKGPPWSDSDVRPAIARAMPGTRKAMHTSDRGLWCYLRIVKERFSPGRASRIPSYFLVYCLHEAVTTVSHFRVTLSTALHCPVCVSAIVARSAPLVPSKRREVSLWHVLQRHIVKERCRCSFATPWTESSHTSDVLSTAFVVPPY